MDWASVVSAVTAFCLYVNTLDSDFVYDDKRAILSNDDVRPDSPLSGLVFHDFWGTPLGHSGSHGSYRPLAVLSFRLNALLAPGSFHLANVLLHAAVSGVFVRLVRRLTARGLTAWAAGLLFAAHPVHSEAVAGLVGRADVGAGLFLLLALLAYCSHVKLRDHPGAWSRAFLPLTFLLGLCAMLTKEQGIAVFVICAVYEVLYSKHTPLEIIHFLIKRPSVGKSCSISSRTGEAQRHPVRCGLHWLVLSFCLLAALRTYLIGGKFPSFAAADNPAAKSDSFLTRTLTFLYLPAFNFYLLLCPTTLSFDWSMDAIPLITTFTDKRNLITIVFYSALVWIIQEHAVQVITMKSEDQQYISTTDTLVDLNSNHKCQQQNYEKCASSSPSHNRNYRTVSSNNSRTSVNPSLCLNNNVAGKERSERCSCESAVGEREVRRGEGPRVVLMGTALLVVPFIPATNLVAYVGFVVAERVLYMPSLGYCLLVGHGLASLLASERRGRRVAAALAAALLLGALGARTVQRNSDWRDEESLYRAGTLVNPPKAYGNLGSILSLKGNYDEAELCYKKALTYRPNMADVHYNLGVLLQSQQRWGEAIASYEEAIRCRRRLAVAYLNLGLMLAKVGRLDEAMSTLRAGATLDGTGLKDPRGHALATTACLFQLGRLVMEQGDLQGAVEVFLQAVARKPPHYQPQSLYNLLGEAYCRLGRDADAESWFRAALRSKPDHVPAHLTYGRLLARNESRVREAEGWYRRAEALAPQDAGVFRHYGQFLLSQKRPREAVAKFERAMQLSDAQYEDAMNAATSLRLTGELERAEFYYKMAVQLRPQEPAGVANLGALYHMTGRLQEAEAHYQQALELLPGDHVTSANLRRLRRLQASEKQRLGLQREASPHN